MSTLGIIKRLVFAAAGLSMTLAGAWVAETSARTMVRVAYSSISGAGVVTWLAVDKGLFAKNDLDVELIYVAGSQARSEERRVGKECWERWWPAESRREQWRVVTPSGAKPE